MGHGMSGGGERPEELSWDGHRQSAARPYRSDIDGLRAVAVLAVVAFHVKFSAFPGGYIGVDVFFVISGYLIGSIILEEVAGRAVFPPGLLRATGPAHLSRLGRAADPALDPRLSLSAAQ